MTTVINEGEGYPHENHRSRVGSFHGLRIGQLDDIGAPEGFVVDGKKGDEFWNKIQAFAFPLMTTDKELGEVLQKVREKYGEDVFMVLIPDDETFEGWAGRPVIPGDLDKEWSVLLDESLDAIREGDNLLSEMKRHAAMLVTGWADTK